MCSISASQIDSTYRVSLRQLTDFTCYFAYPERYAGITDYLTQVRGCTRKFGLHAQSNTNCSQLWLDAVITLSEFF